LGLALAPVWPLPLYPPTRFDETLCHLANAAGFVRNHNVFPNPFLRHPVAPQTNQMLFTLMLVFSDDIAARLIQFLMMLLVACALYGWGRRICSPRAGLWAAALWLSNPIVLWFGASAYVDMGLALFVTLAGYAFGNWLSSKQTHWLLLSGISSGFAVGSKYLAIFFLVVFGATALFMSLQQRHWKGVLLSGILTVCVAAPWYVRSAYYAGSPFSPFYGRGPENRRWSAEDLKSNLEEMSTYGAGKSWRSLLLLPWNLTWHPERFHADADLSPIYLFVCPLLPILAIRSAYIRGLLCLLIAYVLFCFFSVQVLRYLVPILPLLSLASALSLETLLRWLRLPSDGKLGGFISIVGAVVLFIPGWAHAAKELQKSGPLPATPVARNLYLARKLPSYPAYEFLNRLKGSDYRLYALGSENMTYFANGAFMGDWFGPARYGRVQNKLGSGDALYGELRSLGADFFLVATDQMNSTLPSDDFFNSHFKLIYACPYASLFELTSRAVRLEEGPQLLDNPGFESLRNQQPTGWGRDGTPIVDDSGNRSHEGKTAVLGRGTDNVFYQIVKASGGKLYRLVLYARAAQGGQQIRLQVNWQNDRGKFLKGDTEVRDADTHWKRYEMRLTIPQDAALATIYAKPHANSEVWFDDFSFTEIRYDQGSPSPASMDGDRAPTMTLLP
jgi:hypothetical protein